MALPELFHAAVLFLAPALVRWAWASVRTKPPPPPQVVLVVLVVVLR